MTNRALLGTNGYITKIGGKSERPSSPPHPALGIGDVNVDEAQRASGLPASSRNLCPGWRRRR